MRLSKKSSRLSILALNLALVVSINGQQQGGGQTGGQGGQTGGQGQGQGGGTQPPANPGGQQQPRGTIDPSQQSDPFGRNSRSNMGGQRRPMFISGKVAMSTGGDVPQGAVIERMCSGHTFPEGHVDSRGNFSFQLGQNQLHMMDASTSSIGMNPFGGNNPTSGLGMPNNEGLTEQELIGCELRVNLAGHRSSVYNLSGRRFMDNPDIGTLFLYPIASVQGGSVSMFNLKAPKKAQKAHQKGMEEAAKEKFDKAIARFEEALQIYPEYAQAWYDLGRVYEAQQKPQEAEQSFRKAIEIDSKFVSPYLGLTRLAIGKQDWREVANHSSTAVRLNPVEFPDAFFYNAIAHFNMQNMPYAEASAREAIKLDPGHRLPKSEYLLGLIMAQKGELKQATEFMQSYVQHAPNAPDVDQVKKQMAQWQAQLPQSN